MKKKSTLYPPFLSIAFALVFIATSCKKEAEVATAPVVKVPTTFTNPLLTSGPDPWVFYKDNQYYYMHTVGNKITITKTKSVAFVRTAAPKTVWTPPATGPYSKDIWAPELHFLDGKWYIYFAADDGVDANHRMYVLENPSPDPTTGTWSFKGKISPVTDKWAIDGSVFEYNGQRYFIWSGWDNVILGQHLYIAKMANPWTIEGERVRISGPTHSWERNGLVNEGPQIIKNPAGKVFLVFSASGCWTDHYALGLLSLKENGDPLNASDWTKKDSPVFSTKAESNAYGPGHNGFFKSRDGKEDWIIYHANSNPGKGCDVSRNPRIQKFTWNNDGTPNFGEPLPINVNMARPSGEIE